VRQPRRSSNAMGPASSPTWWGWEVYIGRRSSPLVQRTARRSSSARPAGACGSTTTRSTASIPASSHGIVTEDKVHGADWMALDERYRTANFVLVDESHNYRNPNRAHRALHSFLAAGNASAASHRNAAQQEVWDLPPAQTLHRRATTLPSNPPNLKDSSSRSRPANGGC
jgi:hypothetical protein